MAQNGRKGGGGRKKTASATPKRVAFDYIKSNYFRVIKVDGVWGGLSPSGDIHMAVYNQRKPYPQQLTQEVSEEGEIGKEVDRRAREGDIVREIEAALVFTPELAHAMIKWLEAHLAELEKFEKERRSGVATPPSEVE